MKKIIGIIICFVLILGLGACSNHSEKYNSAMELLKKGEFLQAKATFDEIDYEDSKTKSKQCQYLYATELFYNNKYLDALEQYGAISDFEDASKKMEQVVAHAAKKYLNNEMASDDFDLILNKYQDLTYNSDEIADIFYLRAHKLYFIEQYGEAFEFARHITDYEDADKLSEDAHYMKAISLANSGYLVDALTSFVAIASQEDQYRNCVEHAIGIRCEIICSPYYYGTAKVENGSADTEMSFSKSGSYMATGYVSAKDSSGDLILKMNFSAMFAYDCMLLAKDDNVMNLTASKEQISQTGIRKNAVYTVTFTAGPLKGMTFKSSAAPSYYYADYRIGEYPNFRENTSLIRKITQKYSGYDTSISLPESIESVYSFKEIKNKTASDDLENTATTSTYINENDYSNNENIVTEINSEDYDNNYDDNDSKSEINNTHNHIFSKATCTRAKTCKTCGKTEGSPLEHNWESATCTAPKTCKTCGMMKGSALGHSWENATCTTAKTCKTCGTKNGSALGHSWKSATCTLPSTCKNCNLTYGTARGHSWQDATCTKPKTCEYCNATTGVAKGHQFDNYGKKSCSRCFTTNPDLPKSSDFTVVYRDKTSTYNGCVVEIKDYYFEELDEYFAGFAWFRINVNIKTSGRVASILIKCYDENGEFLRNTTAQIRGGISPGEDTMGCYIPVGAKRLEICDASKYQ